MIVYKYHGNIRYLFNKIALLCIIVAFGCFHQAAAQNTSNKGKDFWVAYAAHIDQYNSQMSLYITSTLTTSGTVSIPGKNYEVGYTVQANAVTIIDIPTYAYVESFGKVESQGIRITAEDPVVVYAHIYSKNRSGATLVLPTSTLGREYYTIGYEQKFNANMPPTQFAQFMIVAVEDNTLVEITPSALTRGGQPANVPFNVTLMKGQVYQVQSTSDLTGSMVKSVSTGPTSCKRIAVFSGSSFTPLGCDKSNSGDNLIQQLYPISAWGQNFATAPLKTRLGGDIFRVLASENGTAITVNDTVVATLDEGQFYDFERSDANYVEANHPIMLAQYPRSQNCDKVTGDPEMIILSPVEQQLKNITLYSSPFFRIKGHYINILMKTADTGSFRIDGKTVDFAVIPSNPEYAYAQNIVQEGNHTLTAAQGFNAVAYGFGNVESYGYSAGANIKNLNQNITFSAETYCDGETAGFTGFASYTPKSWKWYFGDGEVSTEINPTHLYDEPGIYAVSLVTTKTNGYDCDSQDSTAVELIVYPKPKTAFTYQNVCEGDITSFEDASTSAFNGNHVTLWLWDFGDGATSTEQHPEHEYTTAGVYDVKLQVTTAIGCSDEIVNQVKINPLPAPDFEALPVCVSETMAFHDQTAISEGQVVSWKWDFGDGTTAAEQHPEHNYEKAGSYSVTLQATSASGCVQSVSKHVTVHPEPVVDMDLPAICLRDEAYFVNLSSIESGTMTYQWDFGDGAVSSMENPSHKYFAERIYTVRLVATSDKGCVSSIQTEYTVSGAEPIAEFTYTDVCQKEGVKFTDISTIAFGNIIRWEWDFGDGSVAEEQHPVHNYKSPGVYTVALTVYSGIICQSTTTQVIEILPSPDAVFTTADVCQQDEATFLNSSIISTGAPLTFSWDFGDGTGSSEANPTHLYQKDGTYKVTLVVTAPNGCKDTVAKEITIHPDPQVSFSPEMGCLPDVVYFQDQGVVATGDIVAWRWDFGDGNGATVQHPSHKFTHAGFHRVRLEVVTDKGCIGALEQEIEVVPAPIASAGDDQVPLCDATSTRLTANYPAPASGTWTVMSGTGGTFSDPHDPEALFSGQPDEIYALRWTVMNSPCQNATDDVQIKFSSLPTVNAGEEVEIIEGETTSLAGSGDGVLLWSPAHSLNDPGIPAPVATPAETTTYTLLATSADGCTKMDSVTVNVLRRLKIPTGISPNGDGINDLWILEGAEDYQNLSVKVFNRWGDEVFESSGYTIPWDGTNGGKQLSDGVYYFVINIFKGREPYTGSITVLK